MNQAPKVKPWIDAIHAYVPGKALLSGIAEPVKLSANENPLGASPLAVAAMAAVAGQSHRYPDGGSVALREAIAALHGLEFDHIVCGTGSDELLQLLALAYAGVGDEVLFSRNSFMVYPIAAQRAGAVPVIADDRDYTADVDALLAAVTERTRLVYLANPNNPTGTVLAAAEVRRLHAGLRGDIVFVYDAAYAEYMGPSPTEHEAYETGFELARAHANVVVTRTFSKIYGLAAERIGWAYGAPGIIAALDRIRGPFNVPSAGGAGAVAAIADQAWVDKCREHNRHWRGWLGNQVAAMGNAGLRAIPSGANFVLIEFPETGAVNAAAANAALMADGFLVRWVPSGTMARTLRITIGTEAETRGVVASLRRFVMAQG